MNKNRYKEDRHLKKTKHEVSSMKTMKDAKRENEKREEAERRRRGKIEATEEKRPKMKNRFLKSNTVGCLANIILNKTTESK